MFCTPASLGGEAFTSLTGLDLPEGAVGWNGVYLAGLSLLFASAAYVRIERKLDRRPFHEF
jgi:hypothetical protein